LNPKSYIREPFDDAELPDEVIGPIEMDVAFLNNLGNEKSDNVERAI